jgi:hypothetical protein
MRRISTRLTSGIRRFSRLKYYTPSISCVIDYNSLYCNAMEALAALAVVGNVMQLISFCHETFELCVKIHKRGFADENLMLTARRIETLCQDVELSIKHTARKTAIDHISSPPYKELYFIASDCISMAKKLSVELDKISNSAGATAAKVFRTIWKRKHLEKLESTMQKYQTTLDSRLLVELL